MRRMIVTLVVLLGGCDVAGPEEEPTSTGSVVCPGLGAEAPPSVTLVVTLPDGTPVEGAQVLASNSDCVPGTTDAQGRGTVSNVASGASVRVDGRFANATSSALASGCWPEDQSEFPIGLALLQTGGEVAFAGGTATLNADPTAATQLASLSLQDLAPLQNTFLYAFMASNNSKLYAKTDYIYSRVGGGLQGQVVVDAPGYGDVTHVVKVDSETGDAEWVDFTATGPNSGTFNIRTGALGAMFFLTSEEP